MPIRYGIFQLGQIWSVVGDNGVKLAFPTLAAARSAGETMVLTHLAFGQAAELLMQDDAGRLLLLDAFDVPFELRVRPYPRSPTALQ